MSNSITPSEKRYNKNFVPKIDDSLTRRERAIRAAALVDTEGFIIINPSRNIYALKVAITSTNYSLLQWLQDHYAGTINIKTSSLKRERHLPCWDWSVASASAGDFLAEIFPFLMIKQGHARIGLKLRELQGVHMARVPVEDKVALWRPLYEEMKALNRELRYHD